jgi:hypothetical protein
VYVYCVAGDGLTSPQYFHPFQPTNLADRNPIQPGSPVIFRSNSTGRFCRVTQMSLTRQGLLCDQTTFTTATPLIYQATGLAHNTSAGLRPLLADGLSWQMYVQSSYGWSNLCLKPAPNGGPMAALPPSPNNAPRMPPPPPQLTLPLGGPLIPNTPYNIRDAAFAGSYCRADSNATYVTCTAGTGGTLAEAFRVFRPSDLSNTSLIQIGETYVMHNMATGQFCRSVTRSSTR